MKIRTVKIFEKHKTVNGENLSLPPPLGHKKKKKKEEDPTRSLWFPSYQNSFIHHCCTHLFIWRKILLVVRKYLYFLVNINEA